MTQGPFSLDAASGLNRWTAELLNRGLLQRGNLAARPASGPGYLGVLYLAEDTDAVLYSNGTNAGGDLGDGWSYLFQTDAAANQASLRTLGNGELQGAAGNHQHNAIALTEAILSIAVATVGGTISLSADSRQLITANVNPTLTDTTKFTINLNYIADSKLAIVGMWIVGRPSGSPFVVVTKQVDSGPEQQVRMHNIPTNNQSWVHRYNFSHEGSSNTNLRYRFKIRNTGRGNAYYQSTQAVFHTTVARLETT